jgi:hypothetical protein
MHGSIDKFVSCDEINKMGRKKFHLGSPLKLGLPEIIDYFLIGVPKCFFRD